MTPTEAARKYGGLSWLSKLFQAQDSSSLGRDHRLMPGRVPNNLDIRLFHPVQIQQLLLGVSGNHTAHAAAWSRQGHLHVHAASPARQPDDVQVIDQAEINDVEGDFRIETGP